MENLYRDILQLNHDIEIASNKPKTESTDESSTINNESKQLLDSIIEHYFNDKNYLFADMFGQFNKGQTILERLYPHLEATNHVELVFVRFYSSLSYMIHQASTAFHIQSTVINTIGLMHQQINAKKIMFEQLLSQVYTHYNECIKGKLAEFCPGRSSYSQCATI